MNGMIRDFTPFLVLLTSVSVPLDNPDWPAAWDPLPQRTCDFRCRSTMYSSSTLAVVKPSVLYIALGFHFNNFWHQLLLLTGWFTKSKLQLGTINPHDNSTFTHLHLNLTARYQFWYYMGWITNNTWCCFQLVVTTDIRLNNWMWIL